MPNKLLIGLLDDNRELLCHYENLVDKAITELGLQAEIISATDRTDEFYTLVANGKINVCFMDINLGNNQNGIKLAKDIREAVGMTAVEIVFITSFAQFMQAAFRIKPYNYLMKPISYNTIKKELVRLSKTFLTPPADKEESEYLIIQNRHMLKKIKKQEIIYIDYSNFKTSIYALYDQAQFYIPLNSIKEQLPEETFLYSQRNTIINTSYVTRIDFGNDAVIYLKNGHGPIALSRKYKKDWKKYAVRSGL